VARRTRVAVVGIPYIPASPLPAVVAHYGAVARWRPGPCMMAAAVPGRVRWSPGNWGRSGTRDVRRVPPCLANCYLWLCQEGLTANLLAVSAVGSGLSGLCVH
jgi:hypothetical protein